MLSISSLQAGYGTLEVLRNIDLRVAAGEAVGLIGPNGAGKSTVLKAIFGIADVRAGSIAWQGKNILKKRTNELLPLGISYVPQGRLVFPHMSVDANLEMGAFLVASRAERKLRMQNVCRLFPALMQKLHVQASALSGGQQQMLALGRALMMEPQLLLLDEPSLGLSPKVIKELYQTLRAVNASGTALLIVEQNVRQVLSLAQRVYLLAQGEVRHTGTPDQFQDPEKLRTWYLGDAKSKDGRT
ncbi:hypothetical protein A3I42_00405 [Candidatus Uhrbacteria bacterium RIFCSPLOWO2_02_FULL_49_11]|uniref:ABC transporter domain-containing protein n=1 Tax=Candidatus Uhrbacteria bacterium RIFCSPLOWO2_02_FULL_49_11 TaxID=1802409 RepID=A0A1F7VBI9_9BACT|nr:MAG: hypothetical protein A3I42_00405 [Candidatus Uhrbacteria bacterium RIFCSPLOWO2_02_FULL_49_11]